MTCWKNGSVEERSGVTCWKNDGVEERSGVTCWKNGSVWLCYDVAERRRSGVV